MNENFSMFIRTFLPRYSQPDADAIENLSMPIVVDQKRLGGGSHSTMGTITDIYPVLRRLYSQIGKPHVGHVNVFSFNDPKGMCPSCNGLGRKVGVDLDLFLDAHNGTSVVALNDGHGVFTRVTTGTWPATEIHEMFDINGDGKIDLNVTFQHGGSQWWINHSTPGHVNFTPTNVTRDGNTSREQVMFDFNGDGKVDWFRSAPPGLVVDFGDGMGGFTAGSLTFTIPGTTSNNNASFLPGDFDGDGKIDLLVLTGGNYDGTPGATALWQNNGNMTFTDVTASSGLPGPARASRQVSWRRDRRAGSSTSAARGWRGRRPGRRGRGCRLRRDARRSRRAGTRRSSPTESREDARPTPPPSLPKPPGSLTACRSCRVTTRGQSHS